MTTARMPRCRRCWRYSTECEPSVGSDVGELLCPDCARMQWGEEEPAPGAFTLALFVMVCLSVLVFFGWLVLGGGR